MRGQTNKIDDLKRVFAENNAAFLFVDVQKDYFGAKHLQLAQYFDPQSTKNIIQLADRINIFAKTLYDTAPHLQRYWCVHTHNDQLKNLAKTPANLAFNITAEPRNTDHFIAKNTFSAFKDTQLHNALQTDPEPIKTLFIAGCMLEFCISNTCKDALAKNYDIYLLPDLIYGSAGRCGAQLAPAFARMARPEHPLHKARTIGAGPLLDIIKNTPKL